MFVDFVLTKVSVYRRHDGLRSHHLDDRRDLVVMHAQEISPIVEMTIVSARRLQSRPVATKEECAQTKKACSNMSRLPKHSYLNLAVLLIEPFFLNKIRYN